MIEWWDLPFLLNKTYDDIDAGLTKIDEEDSLATWFVQHPVPIRPPGDNGPPAPKPLILTKRVCLYYDLYSSMMQYNELITNLQMNYFVL